MKNLKNEKAFTIIELIVVVAILGILVLLAGPRMLGYVEKAELARIQHDVKVMEQEIVTMFMNNDDEFKKWENNSKDFNQLIQENKLFGKEGIVKEIEDLSIDNTYKVIPEKYKDKINTKLKGTFYANSGGKVYYEDDKTTEDKPIKDDEIADLINEGFIPVATAEELNNIRNAISQTYGKGSKWEGQYEGGLDKKYVQVANIDLSDYLEEGWAPIGNDSSRFTGSFNGNGYSITGLTINRSGTNYVGLFGHTDGATICNVALENIDITGRNSTGGLVGYANKLTITNSYATGEVTGTGNNTGGLVGYAYKSSVTNSYATGSVTGTGNNTGGFVGYADYNTTISNSYATGSVTGTDRTGGFVGYTYKSSVTNSYATGEVTGTGLYTGGLVGRASSSSTVSNSYATGSVNGGSYAGGLVGQAWDNTTITNSYATGSVTGGIFTGGLVGDAYGSNTVTNSYWDTETTGQSISAGGEGKTTNEMKTKGTYKGWNFNKIWQIDEGVSYPTLR